jgi:hypothetical protein
MIYVMIVAEGQTLIDIAIQYLGSADAAYDLATLNGMSITDKLSPGQTLELPAVVDKDVVAYYANRGIVPATDTDVEVAAGTFDKYYDLTFAKE